MTKKETIVRLVAQNIIDQGGFAMQNGGCKYRAADGKKCAIGGLIPDEMYNSNMECNSARSLLSYYSELKKYLTETYGVSDPEFWLKLQIRVHDKLAGDVSPRPLTPDEAVEKMNGYLED